MNKQTIKDDAAKYLNITVEQLDERIKDSRIERKKRWDELNPQTPKEIDAYYEGDEYIIENLVDFTIKAWDVHFPNVSHFGNKILDFGCGLGYLGESMAEAGKEVTIADVETKAFDFANKRMTEKGLDYKSKVLHGGMLELDEKYDAIFCVDVVEHIVNPVEMLWHFYEHLNPGGKLFLTNLHAQHDDIHAQHIIYQPPMTDKFMKLMGYKQLSNPRIWQK